MKMIVLAVCIVIFCGCSFNKTMLNLAVRPNEVVLSLDYSKCTPKYYANEELPHMRYEKH